MISDLQGYQTATRDATQSKRHRLWSRQFQAQNGRQPGHGIHGYRDHFLPLPFPPSIPQLTRNDRHQPCPALLSSQAKKFSEMGHHYKLLQVLTIETNEDSKVWRLQSGNFFGPCKSYFETKIPELSCRSDVGFK